jgi:hypothetical protein
MDHSAKLSMEGTMIRQNIFLSVVPTNDPETHVLQIRDNEEPLASFRFKRNEQGETVLIAPAPIIEVARGHTGDLYNQANKRFGARWNAWTHLGDDVWSYQIESATDELRPQLTEREIAIMNILRTNKRMSLESIGSLLPDETRASLTSALRFLHETGQVVMQSPDNVYDIRGR